jgi:hypothetical protein
MKFHLPASDMNPEQLGTVIAIFSFRETGSMEPAWKNRESNRFVTKEHPK